MRARALEAARLEPGLTVLDAGAGTGFTTEGIVAHAHASDVTMLDQSPHQLKRSRAKPALADCARVLGDAEALPFGDDAFDRYVSAGSIEYWPDPQRGIAEAYRVLRAGGRATVIGPVRPANRFLRALAETWMLFPAEAEYRAWMERAGFAEVALVPLAPAWYRSRRVPYAVAAVGVKPAAGASPAAGAAPAAERARAPMTPLRRLQFAARFTAGSLAGALFVPIGAALHARRILQERRGT